MAYGTQLLTVLWNEDDTRYKYNITMVDGRLFVFEFEWRAKNHPRRTVVLELVNATVVVTGTSMTEL